MKKIEKVAIIDYGVGNLFSVNKAFNRIGVESFITSNPGEILNSTRVVLPGVGAFRNCMLKLAEADLVSVVKDVADSGKPLLGICVGAQLLFDSSEEFGATLSAGAGYTWSVPTFTVNNLIQRPIYETKELS